MNILIKLTCLVGLVIAPILGHHGEENGLADNEVKVEMVVENNTAKATINYSVIVDGIVTDEVKEFEGTEAEVNEAINVFESTLKSDNNKQVIINEVIIEKM
jgi:K(+)-stimulated pyrophosphate-energized sodium pump